jgi:hypothetical protein
MERTARSLASYGRHGDNNLVHVSDNELRGIEQLTGKKFTRNPHTGLPEAFNFGNALAMAAPVIAGLGVTALTGGTAAPLLYGALASGATSGAIAKMQGKSNEQALTQGLISGVTSYAGGQLMQGVGTGAGEAAGQAATQGAIPTATGVSAPAISGMSAEQAMASLPQNPTFATTGAEQLRSVAAPSIANMTPEQAMSSLPQAPNAATTGVPTAQPLSMGERLSSIGDRFSNIASEPGKALDQFASNVEKRPLSALMAAGGTYLQAQDAFGARPKMPGEQPYDPSKYPEQFPTNPRQWNAPPSSYQPGVNPEYRYFAKGGIASVGSDDRGITANIMNEAKAALLGEHPRPNDALTRFRNTFGDDALSLLRDRVTGGRVRGAGGGMDDLVPGSIEGRQQVRLADGEFVIPADVVSGLGDGSTDQGVRRLHEMMDKVRHQRTGRKVQPKAVGGKISI